MSVGTSKIKLIKKVNLNFVNQEEGIRLFSPQTILQASMLVVVSDISDVVKILNHEIVDLSEINFVIDDIIEKSVVYKLVQVATGVEGCC